jgi:enamine deaminase RidA (YjgF/YER057c/UK114 family)
MTTYLNPPGVPAPRGLYSNASRAGDLLFIAGQFGVREDGSLAGEDLAAQARQTFRNIGAILESQGAGFGDVLKFATYLVSPALIGDFYSAREQLFRTLYADGGYPANTLLVIDRLVKPELLVEIEAVAHVGHGSPA